MKLITEFNLLRFLLVIFLGVNVLYFQSCAEGEANAKNFDPYIYQNNIESYSLHYQNCSEEDEACTYIKISYPLFSLADKYPQVEGLSKKINSLILGSDSSTVEDVCSTFIADYTGFLSSEKEIEENYDIAWYDIREGELLSVQKRVISAYVKISSFYGGAHPSEYVYLRNFDPQTGDSLGLGMIFDQEAQAELRKLAEKEFRKNKKLDKNNSYESMGYWFEKDQFELTDNFAFTDSGLWFYYNDYEIAPYSMGHSEIVLPYSIIAHLFER